MSQLARTSYAPVRFSPTAMSRSVHRYQAFPPMIHADVCNLMDDSEKNQCRQLTLEMFNIMSSMMCPDILADSQLERLVKVVANTPMLKESLGSISQEARSIGGLVIDWKTDYGSLKPRLLLLGVVTGRGIVVRIEGILGHSNYDQFNWVSLLPSCLRDLLHSDITFLGNGIRAKLSQVQSLADHPTIDVMDMLGVLVPHELFAWQPIDTTLTLRRFCFLLFDHQYGPHPANQVLNHKDYGQGTGLPCWRKPEELMTWGRCLSSFQLTFLRNEFVAPFLPLLTYAMFCLAEGRYLPGVGSSVNGLLHFIIAHQRTGGATIDLLTGADKCTGIGIGTRGRNNGSDPSSDARAANSLLSCPPMMDDVAGPSISGLTKHVHQAPGSGGRVEEPSATGSGGLKRKHCDEDTLDLLYESDGELGALASGKKVHLSRSDVVAMWKSHPQFLRFGFEEDIQLAPPRFRDRVTMKGRCTFCGVTAHKSLKSCKTWTNLTRTDTDDTSKWENQCMYLYCDQPKRHQVRACITLHSKCGRCAKRGHDVGRCPKTPGDRQEVRRVYEEFFMQGNYTRLASKDPAWGWDYDLTIRLRSIVVFQGKKSRRFLEWGPEMGGLEGKTEEDLEKMANKQYWE